MTEQTTAIALHQSQPVANASSARASGPMALIETALASGATPEQLTELYAIYRQWMADEAQRVYANALADFQAECPQIEKKKPVVNKSGDLMYKFSSLEDVDVLIRPLLAKHRIVVTVDPQRIEGGFMHARCRVRVGSYYEDYTLPIPMAAIQAANATQAALGTLSYVRRGLICAALNVVCCGEDNDGRDEGNDAGPETITATEMLDIRELLKSCPKDTESAMLDWLKVESLDLIPRKRLAEVVQALKKKAAQK